MQCAARHARDLVLNRRDEELQAGIEAEDTLQLPPRDTKKSDKLQEKEEEDIRLGRELREKYSDRLGAIVLGSWPWAQQLLYSNRPVTSLAFTLLTSIVDGAQPLTRSDCEKAGQAWDDTGNVCATSNEAIVSGE